MIKKKTSLFLFRRDLRIADNTGLIEACKVSRCVFPCYIVDPNIVANSSRCEKRLHFFFDSLSDLIIQFNKQNSNLHLFFGEPAKVISTIIDILNIDSVFINEDFSPISKKRDEKLKQMCKNKNTDLFSFQDTILHDINSIKTLAEKPYKIFSQYYKKTRQIPIRKPQLSKNLKFFSRNLEDEYNLEEISKKLKLSNYKSDKVKGGRKNALRILRNLKKFQNYESERNFPDLNGTTRLSAHIRFGTCSIREIFHEVVKQLGPNHSLISELHWHDFFTYVMHNFPKSFDSSFREKFSNFPWSKNKLIFEKWCNGITGFPIVDAGMRELNNTGFMHNRVRMIVASFLTKDLHINWKLGERYFAKKLIDYDPCVNVGNWQWAASTGCDAQPWFRIFNPWSQQKKYDPDCQYIKKWIPELSDFSCNEIHHWYTQSKPKSSYPLPLLEHSEEVIITKELFKRLSK